AGRRGEERAVGHWRRVRQRGSLTALAAGPIPGMGEPFGPELTSIRSPKVKAARQLAKRALRLRARSFLAEGPQAVREALGPRGVGTQLVITAAPPAPHPALA